MALNQKGKSARRRSVYGHNTGTTKEDVYTCPSNCVAEVTYIHIHNTTGNTDIEIEWYVAADTYTSHFLEGKNLGAGQFVTFSDIELVLSAGDKIQVTPATAAHVDTIITVTETFVPVG
jgi:hypothetical protein